MPAGETTSMFDVDEVTSSAKIANPVNSTPDVKPMDYAISNTMVIQRLQDSLDMVVSKAEQLYYNCDYQKCITLTENILKQDPYHSACLPIHISCLVELKQSNSELFCTVLLVATLLSDILLNFGLG